MHSRAQYVIQAMVSLGVRLRSVRFAANCLCVAGQRAHQGSSSGTFSLLPTSYLFLRKIFVVSEPSLSSSKASAEVDPGASLEAVQASFVASRASAGCTCVEA